MLPPAGVPPLAVGGEYIEEVDFVEVEDRSAVPLDAEVRRLFVSEVGDVGGEPRWLWRIVVEAEASKISEDPELMSLSGADAEGVFGDSSETYSPTSWYPPPQWVLLMPQPKNRLKSLDRMQH